MRLIKKCRIHTAILWRRNGDSGRGYFVYAAPVEIKCRWNETSEQMYDDKDTEFRCIAEVIVDRDVSVGDALLYGELADVSHDHMDPLAIPNTATVKKIDRLMTLRNKEITNYDLTAVTVYLGN